MPRICKLVLAVLFACTVTIAAQPPAQLDLILRNGTIVDGTGGPAHKADVGIQGDRIVFIGEAAGHKAKRIIDATGLIVAPGFIDPHTHTAADLTDPARGRNDAYLMQGVTTVATGNDGSSPLHIGETLDQWNRQGIGTNAVLFIGQGTVRSAAMGGGFDRKPTDAEIGKMKALVDTAMSEGAVGISTGLYYAPGSYATTEEVIELSKVAAAHHGIYDTHMRDESSYTIGLAGSVNETIRIGREAHIPVMISHIKALGTEVWGQSAEVIRVIDEARRAGVQVTASQYPYDASGTSLVSALVPRWAESGGRGALEKNLTDPAVHAKLIAEMEHNLQRRDGADKLLISGGRDKTIVGRTLAQVATDRKLAPVDAAIDIILKSGDPNVASFNMKESDIVAFMRQPWVMTCSDGSEGHPRKYGTFPKKFHEYVQQKHVLTVEQMVEQSAALPAGTLQLKDRGLLRPGYFADIVAFDPKTFRDLASYENPRELATGVKFLTVNGVLAIDGGSLTEARGGRALRH